MKPFHSFDEFYALYMTSHQNAWNRRVHLLGWLLGATIGLWSLLSGHYAVIVLAPVPALVAIWVGNVVLEPTDDVEFKHPFLTARANMRMFFEMLTGQLKP